MTRHIPTLMTVAFILARGAVERALNKILARLNPQPSLNKSNHSNEGRWDPA